MGGFPLVHAVFAALVDGTLGIAQDDIGGIETHCLDQFDTGNACRTRAVANEFGCLHVATGQCHRIDQPCSRDNRRSVLVVVKDRNIHHFAQALLDDEAVRRLDVFEIDAAEGWPQIAHGVDHRVDVFRIDLEIDRIDIGEPLEEDRLSFHHRFGGKRSEIAQPQYRRTVGDDGNHVAPCRVVEGAVGIVCDGANRHSHTRRIGEGQVTLRGHRLCWRDFQLSRPPTAVELQRFLVRNHGPAGPTRSNIRSGSRFFCCHILLQRQSRKSTQCLPVLHVLWTFPTHRRIHAATT